MQAEKIILHQSKASMKNQNQKRKKKQSYLFAFFIIFLFSRNWKAFKIA